MADPDHLAKLKNGVESWNRWRKKYNIVDTDLSGANLSREDFRGANFWRTDLRGAQLFNTNFQGANLNEAKFSDAYLERAKFPGATLILAKFNQANLMKADFRDTRLMNADLSDANIMAVEYDNKMKCRNINVSGCHGSQRFIQHVNDLDFIEETKEKHPIKHFIWSYTSDCGRSWELWAVWCAFIIGIFAIFFDFAEEDSPLLTSLAAFTSFGFGDAKACTLWGPLLFWAEVALGYAMFGALISLVASQMARRSG